MLFSPGLYLPMGKRPAVAGGGTTTLDPANLGTNASLDAAHLKLSQTADGYACCRSLASHSTGKFYFETLATANGDASGIEAGFCNSSESMNAQLGVDLNGGGYDSFGHMIINGASTSMGAVPFGSPFLTLGLAIDIGARRLWATVNGTQYTDSAGGLTGDPAAGTNGFDISSVTGTLFAAVQCRFVNAGANDLHTITANFGGSAYVYSPPSGFGNW